MPRKFAILGFAGILLWMLSMTRADAKKVLLEDSDDGTSICLNTGDTLSVRLKSNPTTGYSWSVADSAGLLGQIGSKTEAGESKLPGAPGFQVFTFRATKVGDGALVLNYFRPFEKNVPPAKTFHVKLSVQDRVK